MPNLPLVILIHARSLPVDKMWKYDIIIIRESVRK